MLDNKHCDTLLAKCFVVWRPPTSWHIGKNMLWILASTIWLVVSTCSLTLIPTQVIYQFQWLPFAEQKKIYTMESYGMEWNTRYGMRENNKHSSMMMNTRSWNKCAFIKQVLKCAHLLHRNKYGCAIYVCSLNFKPRREQQKKKYVKIMRLLYQPD